ncbi:hypothetical protein NQ315_014405 [Exocentrus adspersus]|uniref:RNase H type-1 domain-containing protein n=1 Tax=Exocentrus adspersus TaxID=1586481 RepID=A0AAV8VFF1_9CUCU|nr:hypothetical protein NQ315_014405 [Exocentrus adspersus]
MTRTPVLVQSPFKPFDLEQQHFNSVTFDINKSSLSFRILIVGVLECTNSLAELGQRNKVRLVWVPGHCGVTGNEEADALARKGSSDTFTGPEPAVGLPYSYPQGSIDNWTREKCQVDWSRGIGLRQARLLIKGPGAAATRSLVSLNRANIKIITGLLTGHGRLNKHLNTIGLSPDSRCRLCGTSDEDSDLTKPRNDAAEKIRKDQKAQKRCFDKKRKAAKVYKQGDLVLIEKQEPATSTSRKLLPKYSGPMVVKEVLPNDRYIVTDMDGTYRTRGKAKYQRTVAVDKINPSIPTGGLSDSSGEGGVALSSSSTDDSEFGDED